ncbi:WYL domain-containing protein [Citrobacter sp. FDAARGOS_156]|uniref:WYL domain-containing protein n=1 Tax=Citrobacter sp. FDAARGOS_156 TaxID=1702170 RepID=UPI001F248002|nr:WYL domain-containing protein [Citrobacter sp. FDAARGOS_156]
MNPISTFTPHDSDRLRYIEFSLIYKGEVSRSSLMEAFNIKEASATRDINKYNEITEGKNSYFDSKTKKHIINDEIFSPYYNLSDIDVLCWIKSEKIEKTDINYIYRCQRLNIPSKEAFSPITRAITQKKKVEIEYLSVTSGKSKRIITPHSLFDDGLKIYVRAYDSKYKKFISLSQSRITKANLLNVIAEKGESISDDIEWNNILELEIVPHPRIKFKDTIEYEYRMIRGSLIVKVREATAGFYLRAWNVDCSFDAILNSEIYQLHLKNHAQYAKKDFMFLAPTE